MTPDVLAELRRQTRVFMLRHRAIHAVPRPAYTFDGYGVWRRHEHYFIGGRK